MQYSLKKDTMSNFYVCLLLAGLCILASCHHVPGHQGGHDGHEHPADDQPPAESHQESSHLPCFKIAPNNAEFAFKFYHQIASKAPDKNIFFSPVTISTGIMLVTLGPKSGPTLDQMFSAIGFNQSMISIKEIDDGFHHLLQFLNRSEAEMELSVGNSLFSRIPVPQETVDEARDLLQADIVHTDFQNGKEAVKQINSYIEKKTHGKLVDVLKDLDPETAMVLVSYTFLKGYWEKPFSLENTQKKDFFINNEMTVQVDMMRRDGYYYTYHDEELACEVVRVPYRGNASALFILPEKGKLNQVEQAVGREALLKWEAGAKEKRVDLSVPRVLLKTSIDAKEILQELGITQVFTDQADLRTFTNQSNFKLSKVVHKAYLNIQENGTEAADTNVVELVPASLPPVIIFDRPFLFMIVEHFTRTILFLGRVVNPNDH
ncbi:alpha-1-antiproteinase-like [Heteronotia binoei]|uniref:alpha-1-antiproteinase-like n=1 Tax=Heteronotia binoei TaxID=13085 RepID=UPI00292E2474|nr:alpha-1-antiproteinase-like [Heteronotia binoei]